MSEQEANALAGAGFLAGVLFTVSVQFVMTLLLDAIDAIQTWRRKKREGRS